MLGCSPNGREAGAGLKSADPGRKPGGCSSNVLFTQSAVSLPAKSQCPRREMSRSTEFQSGWAGHLELLLTCIVREERPAKEMCVPLERRNGCWAAENDENIIFKAFSWTCLCFKSFFSGTSLVVKWLRLFFPM